MKHFTKAVCIVDTCSIINLDDVMLAKHDVLHYMRLYFDVHVCSAIKEELLRHKRLVSSHEVTYWNRFLSSNTFTPNTLIDDCRDIGPFYGSPPKSYGAKNAGEHGNTRVALELLLSRRTGHTIFITDDEKAVNGFLTNVSYCFPGINIWTSADVILYLGAVLLKENKTDYESIRSALRDVYAAGANKWGERTSGEKSKLIT
ncbi:MAG: hypothetical protein QME74_08225 [Candidatus Edwardsbacteria bacterium]|nr:hypothetical protein [Candidatus Edwardsbacteria bacterium]